MAESSSKSIPCVTQNPEILCFPPLNGDNYITWKSSMYSALKSKEKHKYIDSRIIKPAFSDPAYESWEHWNNIVVSWIRRTLTPNIDKSVMHIDSAKNLWKELQHRYSQGNHLRISTIVEQVHTIKQGDRSVTSYFTELKRLWEELESLRAMPTCSCISPCPCNLSQSLKNYKNNEYVICFLKGLNDILSFNGVKKDILRNDTLPHIDEVFSRVIQEEGSWGGSKVRSSTAFVSQGGIGHGRKIGKQCTSCGQSNHTRNHCYNKHGLPPRPSDGSKNSRNVVNPSTKNVPSESTVNQAPNSNDPGINLEKGKQEGENFEKATLSERQKTKAALESAEKSTSQAKVKSQKGKQTETRAMHEEQERNRSLYASANSESLYKRYSIEEIKQATQNFNDALIIGKGGYGLVYKGVLDDTIVAIKVVKPGVNHWIMQFQKEVNVLSNIEHPNIIKILGHCSEQGCLVYEYMENGSLKDRLFETPPIPWKVRFKIASEIATGLHFLHQTKPWPTVHRDIKHSNILLDQNYVSKITDMGLTTMLDQPSVSNEITEIEAAVTGTYGYIDPEYGKTGMVSVESDIYSLGIVLLQIITLMPPKTLPREVRDAICKNEFRDVLDPNVTDWPIKETLSYAWLALQCCEPKKRNRPDLTVIMAELNKLRDLSDNQP